MYAGGQSRGGNGGGGWDGARDALLRRRRKPGPPSSSSSSSSTSTSGAVAASPSSPSGRAEEEFGGKKSSPGRRKRLQQGKREGAVARAFRDGLPAAAASCWRGVSVREEERVGGRSRRRDGAADGAGDDPGEGSRSGQATAKPAAAAWCCMCPAGDCALEPNPSANGKEDPGVRSLLEGNDFFAADCNPHADGLPSSSSSSR